MIRVLLGVPSVVVNTLLPMPVGAVGCSTGEEQDEHALPNDRRACGGVAPGWSLVEGKECFAGGAIARDPGRRPVVVLLGVAVAGVVVVGGTVAVLVEAAVWKATKPEPAAAVLNAADAAAAASGGCCWGFGRLLL